MRLNPDKPSPILVGVLLLAAAAALAAWGVYRYLRQLSALAETRPAYSLAEFRETDPALLLYAEQAPVPLPLHHPRALAVDLAPAGAIAVATDHEVVTYGRDGAERSRFPLQRPATALAYDPRGGFLVAAGDRIDAYAADGTHRAAWPSLGERALLTAVAAVGDDVFAGDAGQRLVWRLGPDGSVRGRIGDRDTARGIPGLVAPSPYLDVAVAPDGSLWVANPGRHRLENYAATGELLRAWGRSGMAIDAFCGCCNPIHLAVLPDGSLVTSEKGLPRVKLHGPDGALRGVVAGCEAFAENATGLDLAVSDDGSILVLDPAAAAVRVFQPLAQEEASTP